VDETKFLIKACKKPIKSELLQPNIAEKRRVGEARKFFVSEKKQEK